MKLYSSAAIADNRYIHVFLILFVGILAYSNTLHVPFVLDDRVSIVENHVIKSLSGFFADNAGFHYNPRRFVGYLSFALNYRLGGLDVTGYHILNLAVHLVTSLLAYFLIILTFKTPALEKSLLAKSAPLIAITASLLFVAHPVQTQAVTYISQRFASLATMFCMLACTLYVSARIKLSNNDYKPKWQPVVLFLFTPLAVIAAMFTKEIAFTLPILLAGYDLFFFHGSVKRKFITLMPFMLSILIIPAFMLNTGIPLGKMLADLDLKLNVYSELSRSDYFLTQLSVVATYVRLLFLPVNQNLDYDYPLFHSLFTLKLLWPILLLSGLTVISIICFIRSSRSSDPALRLIAFGIGWFFVTLSIESSIIPIVDVIFEHRLYLPSIGIFMAIAAGLVIVFRNRMTALTVVVATAALLLLIATWRRNLVWHDELSLWQDTVNKSPNKARPHNNLGEALREKGRLAEAMQQVEIAVKLNPKSAEAQSNLGAAFLDQGDIVKALEHFHTAAKLNRNLYVPQYNLGIIAFKQKQWLEAIDRFSAALKINPDVAEAHNHLAVAYAEINKLDPAVAHFKEAVRLQPNKSEYRVNLELVMNQRSK